MNEELMRKYQDTISLLQFRNPNYSFHGEFIKDFDGKIAFKLTYYKTFNDSEETSYSTKVFKYMDTSEKALRYFIKAAQNRVF